MNWEVITAVVVVVCATTANVTGHVSGEALIGVYGTALGYVFGVAHKTVSERNNVK